MLSIEFTVLISVVSVCAAIYFGLSNLRRSQKNEDREEATLLTTLLVKLENIGTGVTEIKSEMKSVKDELKENSHRLVKVEESAKQAHKRIDELKILKGGGEIE